MRHKMVRYFAVAALFNSLLGSAAADILPSGASPLSPGELYDIYAGKTQSWRDGPGGWYFSPDRKVTALAKGTVYAHGKWWITNSGKVCVNVTWRWERTRSARSLERDCWGHARVGRTVWKEYDGEWYKWTGNEETSFSKGYKYQEQVNALNRAYGG